MWSGSGTSSMSAAPITAGAASPCIASRPSTIACGRSAPRRRACRWRGCSAGAAGTGSRPMPPPCSARRPRAWPRPRAAMSRRATARSNSAGASSARIPAATASWSPRPARRSGPDRAPAGRSRLVSRRLDGAGADAQPARGGGALPMARRLRCRLGGGLHPSRSISTNMPMCASAAPCRSRRASRWRRSGSSSASSARAASTSSSPTSPAAAASASPSRWPGWPSRAGIDLVPHSWLTHLLTGYSLQLIATLPRARYRRVQRQPEPAHRAASPRRPSTLAEDGTVAIPDTPGIGV